MNFSGLRVGQTSLLRQTPLLGRLLTARALATDQHVQARTRLPDAQHDDGIHPLTLLPSPPHSSDADDSTIVGIIASAARACGLPPPNALTQSGLTLGAVGAAAAAVRILGGYAWAAIERRAIVRCEFDARDEAFAWVLAWLADQNFMKQSTRFSVATTATKSTSTSTSVAIEQEYSHLPSYQFLPSPNYTHYFWFKNRFMWLTRTRPKTTNASSGPVFGETIVISTVDLFGGFFSKGNSEEVQHRQQHHHQPKHHLEASRLYQSGARAALEDLVEESRRKFAERDLKRTVIYSADQYGNWRRTRSRPVRALSTIVLDGNTKEEVLDDAIEFLGNEKWYADRGIPYRRGYCFFGYPGTGKTSFVTALAGELKLNIYVISLANKGLTDETLTELMVDTPPRCILLVEDIDAAFVSRTLASNDNPNSVATNVTFSGLLNAIDGVAAQEGRILIMTTNHLEKLDTALIRPGRVDVKVLFDKASAAQVRGLFVQFYASPLTTGDSDSEDDSLQLLAASFAERVPEKKVSMAAVQGHLMKFKGDPEGALEAVDEFVSGILG
ncbi:mitochondrial chaperone [Entophlyctis luteolus]|nr:mitochondrial chaperone [Entophlyctis luteolus]